MNTIWNPTAAALLLIGGVGFRDYRAPSQADYRAACLTHEDVTRHSERSRAELSAPCNKAVRERNASRGAPWRWG